MEVANGGGQPVSQRAEFRLDGGYHRAVCVETDVGPLHHYRRRGGADNNEEL